MRLKISKQDKVRVNEEIRSPQVRLIGVDSAQLGVFTVKDAIRKAREHNLDLVEVAPKAKPPVCKIIDYGKFKYEQQKKEKKQKQNQQVAQLKEIRFHPNTDTHDFDFKTKHAEKFLEDGNKVKGVVMFKGREMAYTEQGEELLERFIDRLEDISKIESDIKMEGRNMFVILAPAKQKGKN